MKKTLAILLTLIFTFSCFSVLGTGTALAETQKVGQVIMQSNFNADYNSGSTNWVSTTSSSNHVEIKKEENEETYFARISNFDRNVEKPTTGVKQAGMFSTPFELVPGNEYELTFNMRIPPQTRANGYNFGVNYQPTFGIIEASSADGKTVYTKDSFHPNGKYYADANSACRADFKSTWTIEIPNQAPVEFAQNGISTITYNNPTDYKNIVKDNDATVVYKDWTKFTVKFTALGKDSSETSQTAAVGFYFLDLSNSEVTFDVKDVKLVCTNDGKVVNDIMESDFNDADGTNWRYTNNDVTYCDDNGDGVNDYASVKVNANNKNAGLFSTPFNLVPGNDYELTYYIRVPEESRSFLIGSTFYAPTVAFYQPKVNDAGTKVSSVPAVDTVEEKNNYYAYSYTDSADATKSWARRKGFEATWTIDGYTPKVITNFSDFDYRYYTAVLGATNADLNEAFEDWTKVTVNFTALANTEDEKSQVTAVGFYYGGYKSSDNFVFDIKDVALTETGAKTEEEGSDTIVIPDTIPKYDPIPNAPTAPKGTIAISVSGGDNCHAFTTKDLAAEGEKVSVSASPKIGYKFIGWYENDELVTTEKHFTFNASVNRTLEARVELVTEENKKIAITPDVDFNGVADLNDVTNIAKDLAGWDLENINTARADANGDGETNLKDLVLSARYAADWDVQDKLASKDAYVLPEEDLTTEGLGNVVRAGESEYFNKSTIINEGNRALLVKLFEKAQKGEPITVASIGGSITQGVKDAGEDRSYGKLVSEWFEEKFGIEVTNVNAGIGSTGSLVGVHRLETDVLSHNPDLVILEYSVNDMSSVDNFAYLETYEAIIRRVLEKDIALMTAVFGGTGKQYYTEYLSLHIHSALHYDLPVIDYYSSLFRYLDSGVIKWYDEADKQGGGITGDNLHPNLAGHVMISSAMNYYLEDVYNKYEAGQVYETALTLPEETLFENADLYKTATFYASSEDLGYQLAEPIFNHNDAFVSKKSSSNKVGKGWVCNSGNGVIIFEFKGITSLTLLMMNNKEWTDGKFSISINGVTVVNNASVDTANNAVWPRYNRVFDKPRDVVIQITCHQGTVGIAPIGVTY